MSDRLSLAHHNRWWATHGPHGAEQSPYNPESDAVTDSCRQCESDILCQFDHDAEGVRGKTPAFLRAKARGYRCDVCDRRATSRVVMLTGAVLLRCPVHPYYGDRKKEVI